MANVSLPEALRLAIAHHQAGRLQQAEAIYRQILQIQPTHPDALHLLGVIALQVGQHDVACELIGKALEIFPNSADFLGNLGEALRGAGRLVDAEVAYRRALQVNPNLPSTYNNLGIVLKQLGQTDEAIKSYRQAIALKPDYFQALNNLAITLKELGLNNEAILLYRHALAINPASAETCNNLAVVLRETGQLHEALQLFQRAVELRPDFADAYEGLGSALRDLGRLDEAIGRYRRALQLNPQLANCWNNLGIALKDQKLPGEAIEAFQNALAIHPEMADAHNNLGIALKEQGMISAATAQLRKAIALRQDYPEAWNNLGQTLEIAGEVDAALDAYRHALAIAPQLSRIHSNLLFALNYSPTTSATTLFEEHRHWAKRHADPLMPDQGSIPGATYPATRPDGRIRIGYVSADFRQHPVAFFLESVLEHHDREKFAVFCYSDVVMPDSITQRIMAKVEHWRDIRGLSDDALCKQIQYDDIDILVDLAGHTERNRLLTFARHPAKVQASWIGYFNTTGMKAMDYFIGDVYSSPAETGQFFSEKLLCLQHSRFCYKAPDYAPSVAPLPAGQAGYVTFGCFNNLAKLNDTVIAVWAQILAALPSSKLVLKALALGEENIRRSYRERFAIHGVTEERLIFSGFSPHAEMLAQYGSIDIALDPFPFTGGLTSCEALWMGVPIVTLAGNTLVSRQSASLLSNLNLPELATNTPLQYVAIATTLANSPERLTKLRSELRGMMAASPICNAAKFTQELETTYRKMWWNTNQ